MLEFPTETAFSASEAICWGNQVAKRIPSPMVDIYLPYFQGEVVVRRKKLSSDLASTW